MNQGIGAWKREVHELFPSCRPKGVLFVLSMCMCAVPPLSPAWYCNWTIFFPILLGLPVYSVSSMKCAKNPLCATFIWRNLYHSAFQKKKKFVCLMRNHPSQGFIGWNSLKWKNPASKSKSVIKTERGCIFKRWSQICPAFCSFFFTRGGLWLSGEEQCRQIYSFPLF